MQLRCEVNDGNHSPVMRLQPVSQGLIPGVQYQAEGRIDVADANDVGGDLTSQQGAPAVFNGSQIFDDQDFSKP